MVEPSFDYVRVQWAIWRAGGVAVPLCLTHPAPELEYVLDTTTPVIAIASPGYADLLRPLAKARDIRFLLVDEMTEDPVPLPQVDADRRAMILFTSGTTGRPKGVCRHHPRQHRGPDQGPWWRPGNGKPTTESSSRFRFTTSMASSMSSVAPFGAVLAATCSHRSTPTRLSNASPLATSPSTWRCPPSITGSSPNLNRRPMRRHPPSGTELAVCGSWSPARRLFPYRSWSDGVSYPVTLCSSATG